MAIDAPDYARQTGVRQSNAVRGPSSPEPFGGSAVGSSASVVAATSGRGASRSRSPSEQPVVPRLSLPNREATAPAPVRPASPENPQTPRGGRASPRFGTPRTPAGSDATHSPRLDSARRRQELALSAHVQRCKSAASKQDTSPQTRQRRKNPLLAGGSPVRTRTGVVRRRPGSGPAACGFMAKILETSDRPPSRARMTHAPGDFDDSACGQDRPGNSQAQNCSDAVEPLSARHEERQAALAQLFGDASSSELGASRISTGPQAHGDDGDGFVAVTATNVPAAARRLSDGGGASSTCAQLGAPPSRSVSDSRGVASEGSNAIGAVGGRGLAELYETFDMLLDGPAWRGECPGLAVPGGAPAGFGAVASPVPLAAPLASPPSSISSAIITPRPQAASSRRRVRGSLPTEDQESYDGGCPTSRRRSSCYSYSSWAGSHQRTPSFRSEARGSIAAGTVDSAQQDRGIPIDLRDSVVIEDSESSSDDCGVAACGRVEVLCDKAQALVTEMRGMMAPNGRTSCATSPAALPAAPSGPAVANGDRSSARKKPPRPRTAESPGPAELPATCLASPGSAVHDTSTCDAYTSDGAHADAAASVPTEARSADIGDLALRVERLEAGEDDVASLRKRLADVELELKEAKTRISTLEGQVTTAARHADAQPTPVARVGLQTVLRQATPQAPRNGESRYAEDCKDVKVAVSAAASPPVASPPTAVRGGSLGLAPCGGPSGAIVRASSAGSPPETARYTMEPQTADGHASTPMPPMAPRLWAPPGGGSLQLQQHHHQQQHARQHSAPSIVKAQVGTPPPTARVTCVPRLPSHAGVVEAWTGAFPSKPGAHAAAHAAANATTARRYIPQAAVVRAQPPVAG